MKKYLLIFVFLFLSAQTYAQVKIYNAYAIAFRLYDPQISDWTEWGEWKKSDVNIVIDLNERRIKIFSKVQQTMIIDDIDNIKTMKDHALLKFYCIDKDGKYCHVDFVKYNDGTFQLYIRYSDAQIGYEMDLISD